MKAGSLSHPVNKKPIVLHWRWVFQSYSHARMGPPARRNSIGAAVTSVWWAGSLAGSWRWFYVVSVPARVSPLAVMLTLVAGVLLTELFTKMGWQTPAMGSEAA